ncbi:MAG: SOS response-associated peptidase [Methanomicrobiales archaeon]|nr:SOS response-associated peptidase [Methanomicrobiales archaeon]
MCGRFSISIDAGTYNRFRISKGHAPPMVRYNVAPSQEVPVVRQDADRDNEILMMRWGLVPSWSRDRKSIHPIINARAETLLERPAFRSLVKDRRCLVPATGFFEWRVFNGKRPYYVHMRDNSPFAFAGMYDTWKDDAGGPTLTFTIITTEPNELVKTLHSRMPAILRREDEGRWLDGGVLSSEELSMILSPYPPEYMKAYEVGRLVNNPGNEGMSVIAPVSEDDSRKMQTRLALDGEK